MPETRGEAEGLVLSFAAIPPIGQNIRNKRASLMPSMNHHFRAKKVSTHA
jgi:hypothetical protein